MGDYRINDGYEHRTVNATLDDSAGDYRDPKHLRLSHYARWNAYDRAAQRVKNHGLKTTLAFKMGLPMRLIKNHIRMLCMGVRHNDNQAATCRPAERG